MSINLRSVHMKLVFLCILCVPFFSHNTLSHIVLCEGIQDVKNSSLFNEPYQMHTNITYKSGKREVSCYQYTHFEPFNSTNQLFCLSV